jgi:hypothetical protein
MLKMFEGVNIGRQDKNGIDIKEGDKLIFKSSYCGDRILEGIVMYKTRICKFVINRGEEGHFEFNADVYDIEIIF